MAKKENKSTTDSPWAFLGKEHRMYCEIAMKSVDEMMKNPYSVEEARDQTGRLLQSKTLRGK